jgi:hypothetical protein
MTKIFPVTVSYPFAKKTNFISKNEQVNAFWGDGKWVIELDQKRVQLDFRQNILGNYHTHLQLPKTKMPPLR